MPYANPKSMPQTLLRPALTALAAAALLAAPMLAGDADARRHLRLEKSAPMADSTVSVAPAAIKLWFSEAVELPLTRVRLEGADAKPVTVARPALGSKEEGTPVVVAISGTLAPGAYTVHWSTSSRDGHVVRDSFRFTLRAP
jgi:copper resistance protein C